MTIPNSATHYVSPYESVPLERSPVLLHAREYERRRRAERAVVEILPAVVALALSLAARAGETERDAK